MSITRVRNYSVSGMLSITAWTKTAPPEVKQSAPRIVTVTLIPNSGLLHKCKIKIFWHHLIK